MEKPKRKYGRRDNSAELAHVNMVNRMIEDVQRAAFNRLFPPGRWMGLRPGFDSPESDTKAGQDGR